MRVIMARVKFTPRSLTKALLQALRRRGRDCVPLRRHSAPASAGVVDRRHAATVAAGRGVDPQCCPHLPLMKAMFVQPPSLQ
jgi:hypothetical protein